MCVCVCVCVSKKFILYDVVKYEVVVFLISI